MQTQKKKSDLPCAWCGEAQGEEVSHGICDFHSDHLKVQQLWRHIQKFEAVTSYVSTPVSKRKKR